LNYIKELVGNVLVLEFFLVLKVLLDFLLKEGGFLSFFVNFFLADAVCALLSVFDLLESLLGRTVELLETRGFDVLFLLLYLLNVFV